MTLAVALRAVIDWYLLGWPLFAPTHFMAQEQTVSYDG